MNKYENDILDTRRLMEYMHIGRDRAYALMRSKGFPSMRIGRTYIVTMNNLLRWLENNTYTSFNL